MKFSLVSKNIIFLLSSPELGGAEKQALHLAGYLQNSLGCNVYIYCCIQRSPSELFVQTTQAYRLKKVYTVKNPLEASRRFKIVKIKLKLAKFAWRLRKHNPDLIIPYLNKQSTIAAHCLKLSGAKFTFWNNRGQEIYKNDYFERKAVAKTSIFLINSIDSKKDLLNSLVVKENQIFFLPNFLTVSKEIPDREVKKIGSPLVIGMLAHFRPEKRQDLLLHSFYKLAQSFPYLQLYLVGSFNDDGIKDKILAFILNNELQDRVRIYEKERGEDIIDKFDIAVLVSEKEGMSNSLMEYMYFKKPIICTDHSGSEYLLGDNYEFLISNSENKLSDKLRLLINDPYLRRDLGIRNYEQIINNFGVKRYLSSLEGLINQYLL